MPVAIENELEIQTLKKEILRLTTENNNLHHQLIEQSDTSDQKARKTSSVIRRLENEVNDLKFLNSQYLTRIQQEQKTHDEERKKLDNLLKKWQVWSGQKVSSLPIQKMELKDALQPMSMPVPNLFPTHDPHYIDMVKLAENEIQKLQTQLQDYDMDKDVMKETMETLKSQLKNREEEIFRLSSLVNGQQPFHSASDKSSRAEVLENQIELLQDSIQELEKRLADKDQLEEELHVAQKKNEKLIYSLTDLENQVKNLHSDYPNQQLIHELKSEIIELKDLLEASQQQQDELTKEIMTLLQKQQQQQNVKREVQMDEKLALSAKSNIDINDEVSPKTINISPDEKILVWSLENELKDAKTKLSRAKFAENQLETFRQEHQQLQSEYDQLFRLHQETLQKNESINKEYRHLKSMYDQLLTELKHMDRSTLDLSKQVETLVAQKENFESLYQQLMEQPKPICHECSSRKSELMTQTIELKQKTHELDAMKQREEQYQRDLLEFTNVKTQLLATERQLELLQSTHTQLNSTLQQQLSILQQQSHELTDLKLEQEKHIREALLLQQTQQEVTSLKAELKNHLLMYNDAQQQIQQHLTQVEKLSQQMNEVESEKKSLMIELNHVTTDLTSLIKENQLLNSDLNSSIQESQQLNVEVAQLEHQLKSMQESFKKMEQEKQQWMTHYKKLLHQKEHNNESELTLKAQLEQYKLEGLSKDQKLSQLGATLEQWKGKHSVLMKQLEDKQINLPLQTQTMLDSLEKELEAQKQTNRQLEKVIQTERVNALRQIHQFKNEIQALQAEKKENTSESEKKIQMELEAMKQKLEEMKKTEEKEKEKSDYLRSELVQLQQELSENNTILNQKKNNLESERLFSRILEAERQPS